MIQLILGGARSGKSRFAEQLAENRGLPVTYIATATAGDQEMAQRIAHHQHQRPPSWQLVEEPIALADALCAHASAHRVLLVDCLTLWITNALFHPEPTCWQRERQALLDTLAKLPGEILLVSNEVGQGIVPLGEQTRRYVDEAGWLHQEIAQLADRAWFVVAGLPQSLK
ncbi:Cobinamide kinase [gamma proteobacterium HdN1]|nr:Cobinamide kinase [gamma proteobacterium HdN1]